MSQTSNLTTQGALLKELYTLPPVRVLNDKSFLHDKLKKEAAVLDAAGKKIVFPVTVQRSLGRGSRGDGGILPTAISEVDEQASATPAYHYYALEWTEALEEVSKNREGAFESAVARKMKNVSIDMAKELNRQWYNADANGVLATVPTGAAGATQTVDTVQFLQVGDLIDVYDTTPALVGTRTINSINKAAKTVTFDSTITTTNNDTLHVAGNRGNEVEGLRGIAAANRVLHGIDSATYDQWSGEELNANGAVAGESLFEQLYDNIGENGRGDMDTYLTTRGIRRRLADEMASMRRYLNENTLDPKLGYRSIEVNGQECVIDDDCPKGHVFGTSRDVLKLTQLTQPGFLESSESNGAIVELKDHTVAGQKVAAFQSWYRYHVNMVCTDPARTGQIPDAEDDAVA